MSNEVMDLSTTAYEDPNTAHEEVHECGDPGSPYSVLTHYCRKDCK